MSLDASELKIVVTSQGISDATKALNDLAKAGEAAEKSTSSIGSGAKASADKQAAAANDAAKAQVDAAQKAASAYNATIDMMTEKAKQYYSDKATAAQQELFDGMAMMDKLRASAEGYYADLAAKREKDSADTLAKQQQQMSAAQAWYAAQQDLANRMNATFDKKQASSLADAHAAAIIEDQRRAWQALGQAQAEAIKINNQLDAAQKKLEDDHGRAIIEDKARAWKALGQAQSEAMAINAKMDSDAKKLQADADAFVAALKRQSDTLGMTTKQLKDYNAEQLRQQASQLGVSQQVEGFISKLQSAKGPHEQFNLLTAGSARELMVLGHELSQGSFQRFGGSLIVLAERVNFLPKLLESAGSAAASMGVSLGLLATGAFAVVAAIAAVAVAMVKGAAEQREFNNVLILSGNYAGMTADSMEQMAKAIGNSAGSIGTAKKNILELASSGKFTADQISFIAEAVTEVEHVTGKSADGMIKDFEQLATMAVSSSKRSYDEVSRHVMDLNDKYHFLTAAQFAHIQALDQEGETQAAINEAEKAYADAMKERAGQIKENLGDLQTAWNTVKEAASGAWDAMLNLGKKDTLQDEINGYIEVLNHMNSMPGWWSGNGQGGNQQKQFDEGRLRVVQELSAALIEQKKQQDAATRAGKDQETIQAGIHAMARTAQTEQMVSKQSALDRALGEEKVNNELAKQAIALSLLSKNEEEVEKARKASAKYTDEAIAKRRQDIIDHYSKHVKPKTEGMSGLDNQLADLAEQYDVEKRAMDNRIKLIDFETQHKMISDETAAELKGSLLDKELQAQKDYLDKAISAIDAFHTKDVRLANDAATKRANLEKQRKEVMSNINLKQQENDLTPDIDVTAAALKQQKAQDEVMKTVERQTKLVQDQVDAYNRLPEAIKTAGISQKQMGSEVEQSKINDLIAEREDLLKNDTAQNTVRLWQIDREIEERTKLMSVDKQREAQIKANDAALNRSSALTKIATEQVKVWKDAGNEIEKALKAAFGNSGEAAGNMFKAFAENQASQIDLANQLRLVKDNDKLTDVERISQTDALQQKSAQDQINSYGQMADAAAGFFEKGSTGYQAMHKMSEIFYIAETAMALASIPAKLAAGAATMFAQSGWGAFAGVAAMTALVASFGVAVTGGGGGPMSAADQQKIQGTGTVLGSPTITDGIEVKLVGAKSDSIANSLKIAEKNSGLGLVVQNDMLTALQKLNDSIGSFATLVVRDYNIQNPNVGPLNTNNGGMTSVLETVAGGVVGFAIAKLIPGLNSVAGKIATSIFGGKQTVDDSGITLGSQSLGSIDANGVNAQSYANITTSGGWFSSDKHSIKTQSLGADFNADVTQVVKGMEDTLKTAAKGLGMDGDAFNQKLQSFVVDIGNVSFKGMTGDQIQTALQNVFSKLGDQMAQFAFGDLTKYQKIGEGLMETVVRVANDLQQVNDVFAVLGKTLPTNLQSIAQSEQLITQFGSVDNLTKGVKAYMDAIYSDQEKLAPVVASVNSAMGALNQTGIQTKEQFKNLVDGIDLTTQKGQELFQALMSIAPQFGQMVDAAQKAAKDVADGLLTDVDNAYNALSKNISAQKDAISNAADAAKVVAQRQLDTAKTQLEAVQTVFNGVSSALSSLISATTTSVEKVSQWKWAEAIATVTSATASASAGGDISKMGGLQDALDTLSKPDTTRFRNAQDYAFSNAQAQYSLEKLQNASKQQVDKAQLTIDKLNDTINAIDDQKTAQLAALDKILSDEQSQIDSLKGQNSTLLSIDQGIKALNEAIAKAQANPLVGGVQAINNAYQNDLGRTPDSAGMAYYQQQLANGGSISDITKSIAQSAEAKAQIENLYQTLLGRTADKGGLDFYVDSLVKGVSLSDIANDIKASSEYANIPHFAKGTNNLPSDMLAMVHKGERIVPAADNSALMRKLDSNDSNSFNAALAEKIDQLITAITSGDLSKVQLLREMLKIEKRWDADGLPSSRDAMATGV